MRLLLDACVLYPTVMRAVLIGAAEQGFYQPRWSARILEEWARAARKIGPEGETIARGEIALLTARHPGASVPVPREAAQRYSLPDPDDTHVLAAAVLGSCDGIVTVNARDFPRDSLREEGLWRSAPDDLLCRFCDEDSTRMTAVAEAVLAEARRLSGDDWALRALLKKARLPRLGKRLG